MNDFYTIDKRIEYYRNEQEIQELSDFMPDNEIVEKSQVYPIAQNRTLDSEMKMQISVYDCYGREKAYYVDGNFTFYHEIPFVGILHKHEFIEIFYVIDGYFEQILLGEKHRFEAGEFVITDQNCEHSDYLTSIDASVAFLQIRADYLDEILHTFDERDELHRFLFHALSRQKKEQSFLQLRPMNDCKKKSSIILEQLFHEITEKELGYKEIRKGLMIRLLQHICINYSPILKTDTHESKEKAILYELERFIRLTGSKVNASLLEEMFHYHRNYYNLLFQKYRGMSFKEYLMDIRMKRADELFRTTNLPINRIIHMVGYENTSHFYHLYEKKYGHLPRK